MASSSRPAVPGPVVLLVDVCPGPAIALNCTASGFFHGATGGGPGIARVRAPGADDEAREGAGVELLASAVDRRNANTVQYIMLIQQRDQDSISRLKSFQRVHATLKVR